MDMNAMIEAMCNEVKQNLTAFCEKEDFESLTIKVRHDCFAGNDKIVDFFHATEHLSAVAEALFGKQSGQAYKQLGKPAGRGKSPVE
jgi:hypothetical protein